jgi:MYXO-CTERM domain-containing protein
MAHCASSTRAPRLASRVGAVLACLSAFTLPSVSRAGIDQYAFSQLDWYQGTTLHTANSIWGQVDLQVTPDPTAVLYMNVVGDAGYGPAWITQNFPIFPATVGEPAGLTVYFDLQDLGLSSGVDLSSMNARIQVDLAPLSVAPSGPLSNAPVADAVRSATGHGAGLPPVLLPPSGHKAPPGAPQEKDQHRYMPRVQENINNCITGAYARSIKWLDQEYDLAGLDPNKTAQQVYADLNNLGVGQGSGGGKTEEQMITIKANYLHNLDSRFVTKFLDVSDFLGNVPGATEITNVNLLDWLTGEMRTEDVELFYDSHCITVTEIYKQGGKTFLGYSDDEHQSNPLDTIGDTRQKEGELVFRDGTWYFNNARLDYIVSESPEPTALSLLSLGALALLRRRR